MAEEVKTNEAAAVEEDSELSELLDSAVGDFDKVAKESENPKDVTKTDEKTKKEPPTSLFTDDAARNFASMFSPGEDGSFNLESFSAELQRLAEASTQAAGFESPDNEFSSIISQTVRNLTESASGIQNQFSEEDLMNMFGSLNNLSDGDQDPGELLPFMQKMMQNLLSKEILHPALAGLKEKYPGWLEEHRSTLSPEDVARYEKQITKVNEICNLLEEEETDESESAKKEQFERVLVLLQEMQDCGQPPAELVGDGINPMFDDLGRPVLPSGPTDQCVLQ